jgi:hypothetical protein
MRDDGPQQLVSRRAFSGLCAVLGLSLPAVSGIVATLSSESTAEANEDNRRAAPTKVGLEMTKCRAAS